MPEIKLTRTEHGYAYEPLGLRIDRSEGSDYDGGPRRTTWDVTAGDDAGHAVGLSLTNVRGFVQHIEDQVADLRALVEFYANARNWDDDGPVGEDRGFAARQVLAGEQPWFITDPLPTHSEDQTEGK